MLKNATPRQMAQFTALLITVAYSVIKLFFILGTQRVFSFQIYFLELLLLLASSYVIINYALRNFIYRRVKLIYKSIHSQKLSKSQKSKAIDMDTDIFGEVEREVSEWALGQEKKIAQMTQLEDYRRNYVGNVSHELKTPLFAVQGYILTLQEGGLYDEKINMSFLNKAAKNVKRLQTIIEDLDTISKLESGKINLKVEKFSMKELVLEVFEELEWIAKENNIELVIKDGSGQDYQVEADRNGIRTVLVNLLTNSIKYRKENGTTKVGFYDMEANILVEVADDGIGINEKHLPHLFDRFYRVDEARTRSAGGSGLGLSIVKHIIEAHRQTINIRSQLDIGSTFGFTLKKSV